MYTKLGFLPKGLQIEKLKNASIDSDSIDSSEQDDDQIYADDIIIYAVKNTEELTYIEFHIRSIENDFFTHHDIFVTDTITCAEYIKLQDTHFMVTAGFEQNINLYDCFEYNPLEPIKILKGHTAKINTIYIDKCLMSGSDDKFVIKYDLEKMQEKERNEKDFEVCKIVSDTIFCSRTEIFSDNYKYNNINEIECVKMNGPIMYLSDEEGMLKQLDIRKEGVVQQKKIHDDALTGFEIVNDEIVSVSIDELVIHTSITNFEQKKVINSKNELFCIAYDKEMNVCVCGGKKEELKFLDI